jgi:hypothetical protein
LGVLGLGVGVTRGVRVGEGLDGVGVGRNGVGVGVLMPGVHHTGVCVGVAVTGGLVNGRPRWCARRRWRERRRLGPAIPESFFSRSVTLSFSRFRFLLRNLDDLAVDADPASLLLAVPQCFFPRTVTLTVSRSALCFRHLDQLAVDTAPTELLAMAESLLCGRITLETSGFGIRVGSLYCLAVNADPALIRSTILPRFLGRAVTLATFGLTLSPCSLDNFSIDAAPDRSAMLDCLFLRIKTLTAFGFALLCRGQDDLSINAAPEMIGRRWRRRTATFGRARKRPPPAMWWLRRTRGTLSSGRAVPSVTTTASLPPPTAAGLNPNPLTTTYDH